MTGKLLYERWREKMRHQQVDVDSWFELDGAEQLAWEELAEEVQWND